MILVTGATGTVGREVLKDLAWQDHKVRALVRSGEKGQSLTSTGADIAIGDFTQPESLPAALEGIDKVFLLSVLDPDQAAIQGNMIDAAKEAGVKHVVRLSALGARPDAPISLGKWHYETEQRLEASGIPWTHVRPHSFMQNLLLSAQSVASEGKVYSPLSDAKVAMIDARDIAAVCVAALTTEGHEGKAYEITGPEALSYYDVAEKLSAVTDKEVSYVDITPETAKQTMMKSGMPEWTADALNELYAFYRQGKGDQVTTIVKEVTDKDPRAFIDFAAEYAAIFRG